MGNGPPTAQGKGAPGKGGQPGTGMGQGVGFGQTSDIRRFFNFLYGAVGLDQLVDTALALENFLHL